MALSDVIARLSVSLNLETAAFEKGTRRATKEMSAFEKNMSRASKAVGSAFTALLGAFAVDQIIGAAKRSLDFAASLGEVATQLGLTTRELQEYRFAATQTGIEQSEMEKGLAKLSRTIGEAAGGNEKAAAMFDRLGISIRDSNGNVRAAGDILPEIADAYTKLGSAAEQSALSAEVFGSKLGQKLNPLLAEGAKGIAAYREEANQLGLVIDEAMIKNADEASDTITKLENFISMKFTSTVAQNSAAIGKLANDLIDLVSAISRVADQWRYLQLQMQKVDIWTQPLGSASLQSRMSDSASVDRQMGMMDGSTQKAALSRSRNRALRRQRSDAIAPLLPAEWVAGTLVGGNVGRSIKGGEASNPQMSPWAQQFMLGGKQKAVGANAFGGGFGNFDPGQGTSGWMRMAAAANDMAKPVATIDTLMTRMALQTGVRMVANFRDAAIDADQIARSAQNIIDRLFPDEARTRQYIDDLAILKLQYGGTAENAAKLAEAEKRLRNEWIMSTPAVEGLSKGFGKYMQAANDATRVSETTTVRIARTFNDMAQDVLGSLNQLSNSIRGGGFLDILTGVVGLGLQLGGAGLFGKKVAANINRVPAFANGTSFAPGGLALVGERGPELVNLPRGSRVTPNNELGGMGGIAQIVPSPYFDVVVDGRVMRAAPGIASAGASGGLAQMRRSGQRRVA